MAEEKKVKGPPDFRDILAFIFIILSFGLVITGMWVVSESNISELGGNIVSGAIGTVWTLVTLIIQFYFRKRPSENDGDK